MLITTKSKGVVGGILAATTLFGFSIVGMLATSQPSYPAQDVSFTTGCNASNNCTAVTSPTTQQYPGNIERCFVNVVRVCVSPSPVKWTTIPLPAATYLQTDVACVGEACEVQNNGTAEPIQIGGRRTVAFSATELVATGEVNVLPTGLQQVCYNVSTTAPKVTEETRGGSFFGFWADDVSIASPGSALLMLGVSPADVTRHFTPCPYI